MCYHIYLHLLLRVDGTSQWQWQGCERAYAVLQYYSRGNEKRFAILRKLGGGGILGHVSPPSKKVKQSDFLQLAYIRQHRLKLTNGIKMTINEYDNTILHIPKEVVKVGKDPCHQTPASVNSQKFKFGNTGLNTHIQDLIRRAFGSSSIADYIGVMKIRRQPVVIIAHPPIPLSVFSIIRITLHKRHRSFLFRSANQNTYR